MTTSERISTLDIDSLLQIARDLGREAGDLIAQGRAEAVLNPDTKSHVTDVVTSMDRACERLLRDRIHQLRPADGIHGEEHDEKHGSSGVRWILDPIDGTVNYLYGIPGYAVSIAIEIDGALAVGVVTNPSTGEQYHAIAGRGAFCGETRLGVSEPDDLHVALVATGFGYLPERRRHQGQLIATLLPEVRDIRRFGAASLDLCHVAAGRVDAYYEWGTHIWDWAAGALICREAGAIVTLPQDDEGLVIAAAPSIATELARMLHAHIEPTWGVAT